MRILQITNYYPPFEIGGYEQLCRDVATRLSARGHDVGVLTSDYGIESQAQSTTEENVFRTLKLRPNYGRRPGVAAEFFLTRRRNERTNLASLRQARRIFDPDVAFIWNLQRLPRELAIACEGMAGLAVAYWLAGYTPAEPDEFWTYWRHRPEGRLRRLLKRPAGVVAAQVMAAEGKPAKLRMEHAAVVSQYMRHTGIANGTLPTDTQVIYNGVECESFYQPVRPRGNDQLRILYAGRVSTDKGVHTAVEAMARLAQAGKADRALLHIAGSSSPEYESMLEGLIKNNGLEDSVKLLGFLPRDRIPDLMNGYHVLVLTSIYPEAFSRVVLEAMAAGLAVVGTPTGGTEELLRHNENGLIFTSEDDAALAQQIARLIDDDGLRQRLALAGQRMVSGQFDLEAMVDRVEILLQEAIESERRRSRKDDAAAAQTLA